MNLSQYRLPALYGREAKTRMSPAGAAVTLSLRVMPAGPWAMSSAVTGLSPKTGRSGGYTNGGKPSRAWLRLMAVKSICPVRGPDWPPQGWLRTFLPMSHQASRCSSVRPLQPSAASPKADWLRRCAAVGRLVRGACARSHWPNRDLKATTLPRFPLLGVSNVFTGSCYFTPRRKGLRAFQPWPTRPAEPISSTRRLIDPV